MVEDLQTDSAALVLEQRAALPDGEVVAQQAMDELVLVATRLSSMASTA